MIELQGIYQVEIVRPDRRIELRQVKVGEQIGDRWIIDEGVEPGETVVAEGVQKVREGALVVPMPFEGSPSQDRSASLDSPKLR